MNATITLDVAGTNLTGTTFNIYQDVDLYTTAVASNVSVAALQSGYAVTLDDNSNTVRILSNGACGNFKDIPVNRGDTSPSIVNQYTENLITTEYRSITGNGKSEIFITRGSIIKFSTDNGDTFTTYTLTSESNPLYALNPDWSSIRLLHDGTNLYIFFTVNNDATLHVYRVTNYNTGSGFDAAVYTEVLSQTIGNSYYADQVYFLNKAYYVSVKNTTNTVGALYRTTDLSINFVEVLSSSSGYISSLDNYGKTVYCTIYHGVFGGSTTGVYKSTDNGLNWYQIYSREYVIGIDVESHLKHVIVCKSTSSPYDSFFFTLDGGSTYTEANFNTTPFIDGTTEECFVKKYKSVYIHQTRRSSTGGFSLRYVPNIYTANPLGQTVVLDITNGSSTQNFPDRCVLLQRNSLTLVNGAGIYSFLIEDTI